MTLYVHIIVVEHKYRITYALFFLLNMLLNMAQ